MSCPAEGKLTDPIELIPVRFDAGENTYQAPPEDGSSLTVVVDPDSQRLQLLEPFSMLSTKIRF